MIMVELYHWNLCFSLGIYLFIIQELKVVLQVLSVIYRPFFVTEQHSIGTRCQQTLRIMCSLVILKALLKLILELMFCLCCDLCLCIFCSMLPVILCMYVCSDI